MTEEKINNAKLAEKAHEEQVRIAKEAESSKIDPLTSQEETVVINEDTDQEYKLKLRFPGVRKASTMIEDCRNPFGQPNLPVLLESALKDVIVQPRIKNLDWWNTHKGLYEAAGKVYQFLTKDM